MLKITSRTEVVFNQITCYMPIISHYKCKLIGNLILDAENLPKSSTSLKQYTENIKIPYPSLLLDIIMSELLHLVLSENRPPQNFTCSKPQCFPIKQLSIGDKSPICKDKPQLSMCLLDEIPILG